jgi:hypothetical protein
MAGSAERAPADRPSHPSGQHFQLYRQGIDAPVRWRLLSANNRDMGRGARSFADEDSCLGGIADFVDGVDGLVASLVRAGDNRWAFRLMRRDVLEVTSGHAFDRRTRCERAAARFLELAPSAQVRPGVALLSSSSWGRGSDRIAPVLRPNVATRSVLR